MTRHSTGAAAIALLALVLAGCGDGDGGDGSAPTQDAQTSAPADTQETEPAEAESPAPTVDDLAALMLVPEDFPTAGWELLSSGPGDDSGTGGVCAFDFDEAVAADAPEAEASFTNNALMTFATQGLVQVPDAEAVLAGILGELEGCVGQTEATDGDTTALITSEPLQLAVPGAPVSGCRYAESIVDGTPLYGPFCFGASGDRMLMFAALSPDPNGGITPEELTTVLTAATAKAFTG